MSVVPQGKAIQAMYRDYREGNLLVNRQYQRKLVWTIEEKQALIDSILSGYPLPLILLAERPEVHGNGRYEIIDGIQRLNAIFTFVEQSFDIEGRYFDLDQFATARQNASKGAFALRAGVQLLDPMACASLLDYQLAITVYPATDEAKITDVFGRINSGGRQLSAQERRQAGVASQFSTLVRRVAAELRGDVSQDVLLLSQMPEISIESDRQPHGYGVRAEDTLWCRQGILSIKQLRESEDEQLIADIAASIVLGKPLDVSKERLDELYDLDLEDAQDLERRTIAYGVDRLSREVKFTFSIIRQVIESVSTDRNFLRTTVRPGGGGQYPIKAPLFAIFMAFFDFVVKQEKSPIDGNGVVEALRGLANRLHTGTHYETTENRTTNINLTKGLIEQHFAQRVPPAFGHGPSLVLDLENAVRRSRIESARYEFKQGIVRLDPKRTDDPTIHVVILETLGAIANVGPDADGNLFLGIADKKADADRIAQLDNIAPVRIADHYVVGIDREAVLRTMSVDQYVQKLVGVIQGSALSEPLKTHILGGIDTIAIQGLTVIRIFVPKQKALSFVGQRAFLRQGNSTIELTGQQLVAAAKRFPS
jgi:Protein of unknown function DUF262